MSGSDGRHDEQRHRSSDRRHDNSSRKNVGRRDGGARGDRQRDQHPKSDRRDSRDFRSRDSAPRGEGRTPHRPGGTGDRRGYGHGRRDDWNPEKRDRFQRDRPRRDGEGKPQRDRDRSDRFERDGRQHRDNRPQRADHSRGKPSGRDWDRPRSRPREDRDGRPWRDNRDNRDNRDKRDFRDDRSARPHRDDRPRPQSGRGDGRDGTPRNRSDRPGQDSYGRKQWNDDRRGDRKRGPERTNDGDRRKPPGASGQRHPRDDRNPRDDRRFGEKGRDNRSGNPQRRSYSDKPGGQHRGATGPKREFRGGSEREKQRPEPQKPRHEEPQLPEDISASELHGSVKREFRALPKALADKIAMHLVAAGKLMDSDPTQALEHARYARRRASRIAAAREANGLTAYAAGEWGEALVELRAARRMGGGPGHLAIMADCERALGRPERAIELSRSPETTEIDKQEAVELRIVAAGARRDQGEIDASVVGLQIPELDPQVQEPWSARLFYAYADNLLAANRLQEAFTWFVHAAHADDEEETDAPERLDELVEELGGPDAAENLVSQVEAEAFGGDDAARETSNTDVAAGDETRVDGTETPDEGRDGDRS